MTTENKNETKGKLTERKWKREREWQEVKGGVCFISVTFWVCICFWAEFSPSWPSPELGREVPGEARGDSSSTCWSFPPAGVLPRLSTCSTKACSCECKAWSLLVRAPTRGRSARSDSSDTWGTKTQQSQSHRWLLMDGLRLINDCYGVGLVPHVAEQNSCHWEFFTLQPSVAF